MASFGSTHSPRTSTPSAVKMSSKYFVNSRGDGSSLMFLVARMGSWYTASIRFRPLNFDNISFSRRFLLSRICLLLFGKPGTNLPAPALLVQGKLRLIILTVPRLRICKIMLYMLLTNKLCTMPEDSSSFMRAGADCWRATSKIDWHLVCVCVCVCFFFLLLALTATTMFASM